MRRQLAARGSSGGGARGGAARSRSAASRTTPWRRSATTSSRSSQAETGITVNYNETNYDTWYQNCKNDGLNKTGAYDIYVMDDNWVPEFAAGKIVQSLDQLGLKVNPDILAEGPRAGLVAAEVRPAHEGVRRTRQPELYALVIIDDVEILYYNKDYFPTRARDLGRHLQRSRRRRPSRRSCTAGRRAA